MACGLRLLRRIVLSSKAGHLTFVALAVQIKQENPGAQKLLYGAFGLPFGLALIVICGGELFTANAAMLPAAIFEV